TRRSVLAVLAVGALAVIGLSSLIGAQTQPGQDVKALYDRMDSLNTRIGGGTTPSKVYNDTSTPTFIAGNKLWYRKSVKGGFEFVLVDVTAATKAPAFDHARLATALSTTAAATPAYTAVTLPFQTLTFVDDMKAIEFQVGGGGAAGRAGGGGGGRGGAPALPGQPAPP